MEQEQSPHFQALSELDTGENIEKFYKPRAQWSPEETLWLNVFELALRDMHARDPRINRDARSWMARESNDAQGFDWVCDILKINPQSARKVLKVAEPKPRPRWGGGQPQGSHVVIANQERDKYDHDYLFQKHCKDCRRRYWKQWWRNKNRADAITRQLSKQGRWRA